MNVTREALVRHNAVQCEGTVGTRRGTLRRPVDHHGGTRNRIPLCVDDGSGQIVRLCNSLTACNGATSINITAAKANFSKLCFIILINH